MKYEFLIIGYGSIGKRYYHILKKNNKQNQIKNLSKHVKKNKTFINKRSEIKKLKPDLVIICSKTSDHVKDLKLVNKYFKNTKILIEKPIFSKVEKIKRNSNKIFVGYNLRFHPLLQKLIRSLKNKKIFNIYINCSSYLPNWRKNINYSSSSSASDVKGGGVLKDLSHELDYLFLILNKVNINYFQNKKISNLNIKTNDYFSLNGSSGNTIINMNLKYFSLKAYRFITVDCENTHFNLDLIKNSLLVQTKKKYKLFILKKFNMNDTYLNQVFSILNNKKQACSFEEGLKITNFIEKLN